MRPHIAKLDSFETRFIQSRTLARIFADTAKRAADFKQLASVHGVTVKEIFWTLGQYDVIVIVETRWRWRRWP